LDFNRAHQFLGYVRAPRFVPEYTGPVGTARVLALEWINGKHIGDLDQDRRAPAVSASPFLHLSNHALRLSLRPFRICQLGCAGLTIWAC
jgi:hypothetical protein